jgi:hypothetical protein
MSAQRSLVSTLSPFPALHLISTDAFAQTGAGSLTGSSPIELARRLPVRP